MTRKIMLSALDAINSGCSLQLARAVRELTDTLALPDAQPAGYQYQDRAGMWQLFLSQKHKVDTEKDGSWPIRAIYTTPQPAIAPEYPEVFDDIDDNLYDERNE